MHNFKTMSLTEFINILPTLKSEALSQILLGNNANYANYKDMVDLTIEYLLKNNPKMLLPHLNESFWIKYAALPRTFDIGKTIYNSAIGKNIFNNTTLLNLIKNENFANNVFSTLPLEVKNQVITALLEDKSINTNTSTLSSVIKNSYAMGEFENFQIDVARIASKPTQKQRDFYNDVVLSNTPSNLQKYFNDPTTAQMFLENFNLLSALSINDRTALFNTVDLAHLSDIEMQNIVKLLYNGYVTNFNDSLFKNPKFVNQYLLGTNITDFRRMAKTLDFSHPQLSQNLLSIKDKQLDQIIANKKENYPVTKYKNGDKDDFWNIVVYRYFKTCPHDLYVSTELIQDSRASLNVDSKISPEGKDLLDSLAKIVSIKDTENFTKSTFHSFKHKRLLNNLLEDINAYNQEFEEIDLSKLIDTCRKEFSQNMFSQLTVKNSPGVQEKYIGGQKVYDITNCPDISLLIHSTESSDLPAINAGEEQLVSMSLLDNNHLCTFVEEPKYILGYGTGIQDSVVHAYTQDSRTGFSRSAEDMLYEKVSYYAPIYSDMETFMSETDEYSYNEIKIRASANARNASNNEIMKPDYILYRSADQTTIPKHIIDFANQHKIDIFTINPQKVQKKTYENALPRKKQALRGAKYIEK